MIIAKGSYCQVEATPIHTLLADMKQNSGLEGFGEIRKNRISADTCNFETFFVDICHALLSLIGKGWIFWTRRRTGSNGMFLKVYFFSETMQLSIRVNHLFLNYPLDTEL